MKTIILLGTLITGISTFSQLEDSLINDSTPLTTITIEPIEPVIPPSEIFPIYDTNNWIINPPQEIWPPWDIPWFYYIDVTFIEIIKDRPKGELNVQENYFCIENSGYYFDVQNDSVLMDFEIEEPHTVRFELSCSCDFKRGNYESKKILDVRFPIKKGKYRFVLPMTGFPSGAYSLKVSSGNFQQPKRINHV